MGKSGADASSVSPPAGSGMVAGMGESFSLDLNSGQGNYNLGFEVPDGVAGFKPKVKLEYTHGQRNGPFGLGWKLRMRQIDRRLDFGVPDAGVTERYLDTDVELRQSADGTFHPVRETTFTRYERVGDHWEITEKDGRRQFFGLTANARIADPTDGSRIQSWLLEREEDANGNGIEYRYHHQDGYAYLSEIRYAKFVVRFTYEPRPDVVINGRAGFVRRITRRCRAISLHLAADDRVVRTLTLTYQSAPLSEISLLAATQLTAHGDGQPDVVKNPTSYTYATFDPQQVEARYVESRRGDPVPPPMSDPDVALVALDDLPLPGILLNRNGRQYYWPNDGNGGWAHPRVLGAMPFVRSFAEEGVQFADMDGNGLADMLVGLGGNPMNGYYENRGAQGFGNFAPYPARARVMPPFESGRVRVGDLDGDGVMDAVYSTERGLVTYVNNGRAGWAEPTVAANAPRVDFSDPLTFLADMTGDGMPDIVRVRSGMVEYWVNLGHGRFGERMVMANSPRLRGISRDPERVLLMDVDGDGCNDLVCVSTDGIVLYVNQSGHRFSEPVVYETAPPPIPGTLREVDMDGRGAAGLLYNSPRAGRTAYATFRWAPSTPPYLLQGVDNGVGLVSEIEYAPMIHMALQDRAEGRIWDTTMPFPLWLVSATRETDTVRGRVAETRYRYHDGHFDPLFRRFQGFRQVDRVEVGDESRADVLTTYTFLMNQAAAPGNTREHAHLDRMLAKVERFSLDGSPLEGTPYRSEETTYGVQELETLLDGTKRVFIFAGVTRKRYTERTTDERVEEMTYDYDAFGNVVRETRRGFGTEDGAPVPEKVIVSEFSYAANPEQTIFKAAHITKRNEDNEIVREMRRYYDDLPLGQLTRGLQTREEALILPAAEFDAHYAGMDAGALGYFRQNDADGNPAVFSVIRETTYTAEGNPAVERTASAATRQMFYDADGIQVVREIVNGKEREYIREPVYGKPLEIRAHNGDVVRMTYDAFGRPTATMMADDTPANPTREMTRDDANVPNALRISYRIAPNERLETVTYFDGKSEELQKRVERQDGEVVVSGWLEKNPWGQTKREFEPTLSDTLAYAQPDTAGRAARASAYDAEGRPVRITDYNGGVSTARYTPFEIVIHDANDNDPNNPDPPAPRRERVDVWHDRTEVIEPGGVSTRFEVGLFSELLSLADDEGTIAAYTYDLRGNRLTINHRDAGERRQWFDANDDIIRTLDAEGNDVTVTRDPEGRLLTVSRNGARVEEYSYDDAAPGADGRLGRAVYAGGQQELTYDARGRLTEHDYTINGQVLSLRYEYNDMGKPTALTYPDGTRVARSYYRNGMTRSIAGVIDEVIYNARNLPTRIRFANGVVTDIAYESGVGWVASQRTTDGNGVPMEDVTLSYDLLHRLIGMDDAAPGVAHSAAYGYDARGQLQEVTGSDPAGNYSLSYDYSNGYNLSAVGESSWELQYNDPQRPDRLDAIARAGEPLFDVPYNLNGNITALPGRSFAYNFKNQLTEITLDDGTVVTYEYDFRGQRTRRTTTRNGTTTETLFLGDLVELHQGQFANFVIFNRMRVALLRAGQTRWFHVDRLGSTRFYSDEGGTKIAQIAYHPFGNVRTRSGSPVRQSFAAHPVDEAIGLVYMGRRWYAPETGRYLTPDPLYLYQPERANGRVEQLRLYTYVGNDPLDRVDPTGLSFWSVLGAIVGVVVGIIVAVAVVAAFATGIGFGILAVVGVIALVTVSYVVASATQGSAFGEFMRGFMIGFNAGMNAAILTFLGAGVLGVIVGVINFLAAIDPIANSEIYQGILGWTSWLMPMSWLATAVGLIFFILNGLAALFTLNQVAAVRIDSISIDWGTGTIVTEGGWIFLPGFNGGYNLGNFAYVTPGSGVTDHETGHTLSVAAFGSIFHFVGAIDENFVQTNPEDAYAEHIADSHDPASTDPDLIPMWV